MQYGHKFAAVESFGLGETKGFSIAASGKAFRSLIDSIYSRKIEAPIRELATNAFDGHLAVGKIEPFDVHLPTVLDPTFSVRDYGCSMSHEMVMNRYTTLFDSTKDGQRSDDAAVVAPNNQVGSWGLGSKTPFAYTDAFTLTCWLDGRVRIYSIFIGANGQPQCALAFEAASDEPTGVKVEFPADPGDIEEFEEAAIRVFKGFNVLPNGLPTKIMKELQVEPVQIGAFWKAFPSNYLGNGFFARQGCVIYPIELDKIDDKFRKFGQASLSVVMDFPIGSIEYTNSREFLAYTPETILALNDAFTRFSAEIEASARQALAGYTNRFERAKAIGDNSLFKLNRFAFLSEAHSDRDLIAAGFQKFLVHSAYDYRHYSRSNLALYAINRYGDKARYRQYSFISKTFPDRAGLILLDEKTKNGTVRTTGVGERIVPWLEANNLEYAYVFEKLPKISILRQCGFPAITRISAIPALPKKPRDPQSYGGGGGFSRYKRYSSDVAPEDIPDNALFALVNRGSWIDREGRLVPGHVRSNYERIAAFLNRPLYQINTRTNEKLDRWFDHDLVYDYTFDQVVANFTDQQIKTLIHELNYRRFKTTILGEVIERLHTAKVLKRTPFASLDRFRLYGEQARYKHNDFITLCDGILGDTESDLLNYIIERGRAMGMEILCPPVGQSYYNREPYEPLLPAGTENFFNLVRRHRFEDSELDYLTKEIFE